MRLGSHVAKLMVNASIIIWDEAPMAHRDYFKPMDRSLRNILYHADPKNGYKSFRRKVVLLGGDFKQILPVIPKGQREDHIYGTIVTYLNYKLT